MITTMMRRWKNDIHNYVWHTLGANGWEWFTEPNSQPEDLSSYKMNFLGTYTTTAITRVCDRSNQLCHDGHYGVMWIDAEYECEAPHSIEDLEDMIYGLECAEDNLLLIGIPFSKDYRFHGSNKANKKRRNDALRRKLNLDAIEELDNGKG